MAGYPEAHPDVIVDDAEAMKENYWKDVRYLKEKARRARRTPPPGPALRSGEVAPVGPQARRVQGVCDCRARVAWSLGCTTCANELHVAQAPVATRAGRHTCVHAWPRSDGGCRRPRRADRRGRRPDHHAALLRRGALLPVREGLPLGGHRVPHHPRCGAAGNGGGRARLDGEPGREESAACVATHASWVFPRCGSEVAGVFAAGKVQQGSQGQWWSSRRQDAAAEVMTSDGLCLSPRQSAPSRWAPRQRQPRAARS